MNSYIQVAALALVAVAPIVAEAPKGWKMRVDRSTEASDPDAPGPISFVTMGKGFHATNPQAAVYWNPANTASGSYTLKGKGTRLEAAVLFPGDQAFGQAHVGNDLLGRLAAGCKACRDTSSEQAQRLAAV